MQQIITAKLKLITTPEQFAGITPDPTGLP